MFYIQKSDKITINGNEDNLYSPQKQFLGGNREITLFDYFAGKAAYMVVVKRN